METVATHYHCSKALAAIPEIDQIDVYQQQYELPTAIRWVCVDGAGKNIFPLQFFNGHIQWTLRAALLLMHGITQAKRAQLDKKASLLNPHSYPCWSQCPTTSGTHAGLSHPPGPCTWAPAEGIRRVPHCTGPRRAQPILG